MLIGSNSTYVLKAFNEWMNVWMDGKKSRVWWKISYLWILTEMVWVFPFFYSTCLCLVSTIEIAFVYLLCIYPVARSRFVCFPAFWIFPLMCAYGSAFIIFSATVPNPMHIESNFNAKLDRDLLAHTLT